MREWFRASELAGLPGLPGTRHRVQMRAKREGWQARKACGRQGGGGFEYHISALPTRAQGALVLKLARTGEGRTGEGRAVKDTEIVLTSKRQIASRQQTASGPQAASSEEIQHLWRRFERAPETMKAEARRRLEAVQSIEALCARGVRKTAAVETVSSLTGDSPATLRRWNARVRGCAAADRLAHLLPNYTGRTSKAACSPEAWDYFKADYLRPERPAASACYERLLRIAAERGWEVPSLKTLQRRAERELPRAVRVLAREGIEELNRLFPAQERDHSVFSALEAVNADCHTFDNFVEFEDGSVERPTGVFWQDIYSGKILAFRLVRNPSAWATVLSFGDLLSKWGIPRRIWLDNGREFAAKWLTGGAPTRYRFKVRESDPAGVFTQLGIEIHWCTPYHGQAKPIERAFRDFCEYIARHPALSGSYTGNSPANKPANYGRRAAGIAEFRRIVAAEVAAHNARKGRESPVCRGRSFDQVFNESYAGGTIRKATAEQRALCLLAAESVTASRESGEVRIYGNRYWSEELSNLAGRKVLVRFDPENLYGGVRVYELSGRFVCEAACIGRAGFADREAAREHTRQKKRFRRAARELAGAEIRMDALVAASLLPEISREEAPRPAAVEILRLPTRAQESRRARESADEQFMAAMERLSKVHEVI